MKEEQPLQLHEEKGLQDMIMVDDNDNSNDNDDDIMNNDDNNNNDDIMDVNNKNDTDDTHDNSIVLKFWFSWLTFCSRSLFVHDDLTLRWWGESGWW